MKLAAVTTNFGLGPVSKLLSILEEISRRTTHKLTFIGSRQSYNFLEHSFENVIEFIEVDTDHIDRNAFFLIMSEFDLLINVMNTHIQIYMDNQVIKSIFVDSLSWLWDKPITGIENSEIYFVQNLFLDNVKINRIKNKYLVNPITYLTNEIQTMEDRNDEILVNVAGIFTPNQNNYFDVEYIKYYINIFEGLKLNGINKIIFACNSNQLEILSKISYSSQIQLKTFGHNEFLIQAKKSYKVFSTAGLTFYTEAKQLGIDVFYLLPSNYSQALLLEKYVRTGSIGLNLERFSDVYAIKPNILEEEGIEIVRENVLEIMYKFKKNIIYEIEKYILKPIYFEKNRKNILNGSHQIVDKLLERNLI
ncbi:hypothetical protein ACQZP5_001498 [Enterococcus faecalis]